MRQGYTETAAALQPCCRSAAPSAPTAATPTPSASPPPGCQATEPSATRWHSCTSGWQELHHNCAPPLHSCSCISGRHGPSCRTLVCCWLGGDAEFPQSVMGGGCTRYAISKTAAFSHQYQAYILSPVYICWKREGYKVIYCGSFNVFYNSSPFHLLIHIPYTAQYKLMINY